MPTDHEALARRASALIAQWQCELFRIRPSRERTRKKLVAWLDDYRALKGQDNG